MSRTGHHEIFLSQIRFRRKTRPVGGFATCVDSVESKGMLPSAAPRHHRQQILVITATNRADGYPLFIRGANRRVKDKRVE
jgi:hypothetical protein